MTPLRLDHHLLRIASWAACAWVVALPATATAGLYKCASDDGTVMYQEDPCPPGKELRDFERDPAPVSVVPFRIPAGSTTRATTPRDAAERPPPEPGSRKSRERQGNPAERKFLVPGISEGEVVARIGRP